MLGAGGRGGFCLQREFEVQRVRRGLANVSQMVIRTSKGTVSRFWAEGDELFLRGSWGIWDAQITCNMNGGSLCQEISLYAHHVVLGTILDIFFWCLACVKLQCCVPEGNRNGPDSRIFVYLVVVMDFFNRGNPHYDGVFLFFFTPVEIREGSQTKGCTGLGGGGRSSGRSRLRNAGWGNADRWHTTDCPCAPAVVMFSVWQITGPESNSSLL